MKRDTRRYIQFVVLVMVAAITFHGLSAMAGLGATFSSDAAAFRA